MKQIKAWAVGLISFLSLLVFYHYSKTGISLAAFLASFSLNPSDLSFTIGRLAWLWGHFLGSLLLYLLWLVWGWSVGGCWLRALSFSNRDFEYHLLAIALGMGTLSGVGFILGAGHGLYPALAWTILLGGLGFLLPLQWKLWRNQFSFSKPYNEKPGGFILVCALVASSALFFHLLGVLLPPTSFDELNYQLALPKLYSMNHGFVLTKFNHLSFLPKNMLMLFTWGLLTGGVVTAKLFSWLMGVLSALVIFQFGRKWAGEKPAFLGACLFVLTPVIGNQYRNAGADLGCGFYELLGVFLLLDWLKNPNERVRFFLSSLMWGLSIGCKYSALPGYAVSTLFLIITCAMKPRLWDELARKKLILAWIGIPILLTAPWWGLNILQTGNPLTPLFSRWIESRNFIFANQYQPLVDYVSGLGIPRYFPITNLMDALKLPWSLITQYNDYNHHLGAFYLLMGLSIVFFPTSIAKVHRWLLILTATYWLGWLANGIHITRYFVAGLGLSSLVMGSIFMSAIENKSRLMRMALIIPILMAASQQWMHGIVIQNNFKRPWGYLAGMSSDFHYLHNQLQPSSPMPAFEFINSKLPINSKILVINEYRTYYLNRPFWASTPWDHDYWHEMVHLSQSSDELERILREQGFTHIFMNEAYIFEKTGRPTIVPWAGEDREKAEKFIATNLRKIYAVPSLWVAEISNAEF